MSVRRCAICQIELTEENRVKPKGLKCKPCKSKLSIEWDKNNKERRKKRVNEWVRKIGRVKEYPCEICSKPCYKKYAKAFCSDKCRFFSHVEITKTCWLWSSSVNRGGYGKACFKGNSHAKAHRLAYELFKSPIPSGMHVLHTCDIPPCVNPAHLFLGTTQDNKRDQLMKDRGGKKLKADDVLEIRRLYENDIMGSQAIANLYSVTCSTISNIVKRRVWRHI